MAAAVFEGDEMVVDKNGVPTFKMWFLNRKEYEILDTWDVSALRGSGSHDVKADGAYVPEKFVDVDLMVVPPLYDNPVFRVPTPMRLAYNKSAIAIGVARGAIDAFIGLANHKVPMLSPSKLMDRPIAQHRLAEQEAKLRAARAFLFEAMAEMEEELEVGADAPGPHTTQNGRLACIYASNACMEVVDLIHQTAGTSAAYMKNPLERKLRDAHGCASHRWVSHSLYGELGSIMMGHEASPEFAGTQNALRTS
jgi:alkylation response protein AidB-like acyl-CoA dehydrogenase